MTTLVDIAKRPGATVNEASNLLRAVANAAGDSDQNGSVLFCGGYLSNSHPDKRCEWIRTTTLQVRQPNPHREQD